MTGLKKQVFAGTFISSKSPQELNYLHNAVICVDGEGRIVRVDKEPGSVSKLENTLKTLGWAASEVDIHVAQPGQFFFPGFIGEFES